MNIQKISWKVNFKNPENINPFDFFRLFNKWIPESPEIFIDVADYQHVQDGPKILLAGYHADFMLDHNDRRLGFQMNQKSSLEGDNHYKLTQTLEQFRQRSDQMIQDEIFGGAIELNSNELELTITDRALVPNTKESFTTLAPLLEEIGTKLWGGVKLKHLDNPRRRFSVILTKS